MHPREQVMVSDIIEEVLWVATLHNGFVYLLVRSRRNHEVTYIVHEHVEVPHVSIFLLGCQVQKKIFVSNTSSTCRSCHNNQTCICCNRNLHNLGCICRLCGKEHAASCVSRPSSGTDGNGCTWLSNHEWSIPGTVLCLHRNHIVWWSL